MNEQDSKKIELAKKIKLIQDYKMYNRLDYFSKKKKFHKWQREFFDAGKEHDQRFALCGNRTGKTFSGMAEIAYHATGLYPSWWKGHRINKRNIKIVICGKSSENMRDTTHELLIGNLQASDKTGVTWESDGTGWIPKDKIQSLDLASGGTKKFAKEIRIKHKNGSITTIAFRSYSQGHMALAGMTLDFVAIDEEPEFDSQEFVAQAMTRMLTTKGRLMILATPEHGLTPLVNAFMNDRKSHQYVANVGWKDCEHLGEEEIKKLLDSIPEYQHKMRRDGLPVFSEGLVYPLAESSYTCDPFAIPLHWKKCGAMDLGFTHPTTFIQVAWDKENDIIYVYSEYGDSKKTPIEHTMQILSRVGKNFPIILPHDSEQTGKDGADSLMDQYCSLGLNIKDIFRNPDGSRLVATGIMEILTRMKTGRLKIFSDCSEIFGEIRKYRYKAKDGKPVKEYDDYVDGMRYAVMSMLAGFGVEGDPKASVGMTYIKSYKPNIYGNVYN